MGFDFGPGNCLNGTGLDLGGTTPNLNAPFLFVEELAFVVHEQIVDLFRATGQAREWPDVYGGVKMAMKMTKLTRLTYGWQNTLREDLG